MCAQELPGGAKDGFGPSLPPLSHDIFLAYNSRDKDAVGYARTILAALRAEEKRVWFDEEEAVAGVGSTDVITRGIASSKCFALLLGAEGLGVWQGNFERGLAVKAAIKDPRRRVFPVLLPGFPGRDTLPEDLDNPTAVDLTEDFSGSDLTEPGIVKVLAAVAGKPVIEIRQERGSGPATQPVVGSTTGGGRNRALLVGVSAYRHDALKQLHGPRSDIAHLERALAAASMPSGGEWVIKTCSEPDSQQMRADLHAFFHTQAEPNDTFLLYYSGHGVVSGDESYLCPVDTSPTEPSWTGVSAKQIVELVRGCGGAAKKVVILDCCHAAPIRHNAYDEVGADVAVVLASRGPVDDARSGSEPSPFTAHLVEVLSSTSAYGDEGLTVGALRAELARRDAGHWTNESGREILLARHVGRRAAASERTRPHVTVDVSATSSEAGRVLLLRQLAATLDGLLALAPKERQIPTSMVSETMLLLADELWRLLTPAQCEGLEKLLRADPDPQQTCAVAVRFTDEAARNQLGDLPWEYLTLRGGTVRAPRISLERVFSVPGTKQSGGSDIQRVALFSSLGALGPSQAHLLTAATHRQLAGLGIRAEVDKKTMWTSFLGATDNADVVILQAPVHLVDKEVKVVFATTDETKAVPMEYVGDRLKNLRALTWLLIETVAEDSRKEPALAVRRLAEHLARDLKRPVVAICHSLAYLNALEENPEASTFLPHLLKQLNARWSLDRAAHDARQNVISSLAINDPAIVGIPVVMRPVQQDSPRDGKQPLARR